MTCLPQFHNLACALSYKCAPALCRYINTPLLQLAKTAATAERSKSDGGAAAAASKFLGNGRHGSVLGCGVNKHQKGCRVQKR